jgi:hypothetical protein
MLLKHIKTNDLFSITTEVLPDDHLVILNIVHSAALDLMKIMRFPTRDAMLDFLAEDMPLIVLCDLEDACIMDHEKRDIDAAQFTELRRSLEICYSESVSPQRESIMRDAIYEKAESIGHLYRDKWIEASLKWVGHPGELRLASNPFLEEIRTGLSEATGAPPSTEDILRFLLAHEEANGFYREYLVFWETISEDDWLDQSPEEFEEAKANLEAWWQRVQNHPQPLLAAMWQQRYELVRSTLKE